MKLRSIVKLPAVKAHLPCENVKYNFTDLLGEGAFSKVYLAKKKIDNTKCVIKIYEKSGVNTE